MQFRGRQWKDKETQRVVYMQEFTSTDRQVGQWRTGKVTNLPILAVGGSEGGYVVEASVKGRSQESERGMWEVPLKPYKLVG